MLVIAVAGLPHQPGGCVEHVHGLREEVVEHGQLAQRRGEDAGGVAGEGGQDPGGYGPAPSRRTGRPNVAPRGSLDHRPRRGSAVVLIGVPTDASPGLQGGLVRAQPPRLDARAPSGVPPTAGWCSPSRWRSARSLAGPSQPVTRATVLACAVAVVTGFRAEQGQGLGVGGSARARGRGGRPAARGHQGRRHGRHRVRRRRHRARSRWCSWRGVRSDRAHRRDGAARGRGQQRGPAARGRARRRPRGASGRGTRRRAAARWSANTWPPALVRIGTIGPTVLGAALTAVAIELDPGRVGAPQRAGADVLPGRAGRRGRAPRVGPPPRTRTVCPRLALPLAPWRAWSPPTASHGGRWRSPWRLPSPWCPRWCSC